MDELSIYVKERLLAKETPLLASAADKLRLYRDGKDSTGEGVVTMTKYEYDTLLTEDERSVMKKCDINPKFVTIL
jgi:hypothetical protein